MVLPILTTWSVQHSTFCQKRTLQQKLQPSAASLLKTSWAKVKQMANTIKVQLVKGLIGTRQDHRATVRGLGLRRVNSVSELQDTPSVRGMINKVSYLVKVVS